MPPASTAVSRLMKEFQALQRSPIARANAHPVGDDLLTWKLIIVGEAPYDFPIRIHLDYSADYPNVAPKAYFETSMPFVGGASIIADNGLQSVCLNIFGNFAFVHTEWKNQQSGWTPAYTIETIITSIQGLMMEEMLSDDPREIRKARKLAEGFKCAATGHDGSALAKWWPEVSLQQKQPATPASSEEEEGSSAGPSAVEKAQAVIKNHYVCYVLKDCPEDCQLGFGIGIEGFKVKNFSSPCELLSKEAFTKLKVRQSSTNKAISSWCPIITPFKSWPDIRADFYQCMADCAGQAKQGAYHKVQTPLSVCLSIMNLLVVEVMNASNNLTANDKFIEGYFAFLKLLSHHVAENPECGKFVDNAIKRFAQQPDQRVKAVTSNLGEFILYPLLSSHYSWKDVNTAFVNECHSRCVFWYVQGSRQAPGRLTELKTKGAPHRAGKVYDATETSRRLVCYQVGFSSTARKFLVDQMKKRKPQPSKQQKAAESPAPQEDEQQQPAQQPAPKKANPWGKKTTEPVVEAKKASDQQPQPQPSERKKNPWGKKSAPVVAVPPPAAVDEALVPEPETKQQTTAPATAGGGCTTITPEEAADRAAAVVPDTELVPESVKASIKGMHKQILKMRTWEEYYSFVGVQPCPKDMDSVLWAAVEASKAAGYHK